MWSNPLSFILTPHQRWLIKGLTMTHNFSCITFVYFYCRILHKAWVNMLKLYGVVQLLQLLLLQLLFTLYRDQWLQSMNPTSNRKRTWHVYIQQFIRLILKHKLHTRLREEPQQHTVQLDSLKISEISLEYFFRIEVFSAS